MYPYTDDVLDFRGLAEYGAPVHDGSSTDEPYAFTEVTTVTITATTPEVPASDAEDMFTAITRRMHDHSDAGWDPSFPVVFVAGDRVAMRFTANR